VTTCYGSNIHHSCPIQNDCYRFTQPTPGRDSFGSLPFNFEANSCEFFVTNSPTDEQIRDAAYFTWLRLGQPEGSAETIWLQAQRDAEASLGRTARV